MFTEETRDGTYAGPPVVATAGGVGRAHSSAQAQPDGLAVEERDSWHAAAESPNRRETARSRRMSRKFFGTLRRNQFRREQDLLRQLDITEVLPPTDVTDGDPVRNPEELKSMTTLSLNQKRRILNRMKEKFTNEGTSNIETLMRLRSGLDAKVRQARSQISGAIYTLGFWRGHLKVLQGHFGTDVTAYFVFLRWLFLANLFIGFIILLFLFMPQLVHRFYDAKNPAPYYNNSFSAMDLLTGQGWFYNTEMYYGSYSNTSLLLIDISSSLPDLPYDAPMAYLLTIGAYIGVFFVTMAFSTARSYRANYIESSSEFRFYYVAKVLIGWDCGILNGSTAKERKKSLLRELQIVEMAWPIHNFDRQHNLEWFFLLCSVLWVTEYVSSLITRNETKECSAVAETVARHLVAVVVQLGIIGGTGFLLYDLVTEKKIDQLAGDSYRRLTIGLLVTGFNGVLPFIFVLMSWLQRFEKEMYSILSTLVMTCMLYCSTLGSLMVALLKPHMVALLKPQVGETATSSTPCWETEVGSQLYQLAIMDFLFAIVVMVLVEGMHRLIWTFGSKWIGAPQFDIARNTQNLMYSQVLCWLGIYYCPMITVVTVIKLFILFYLKRYFIKVTCVPNTKHWKGAQMQTWFLIILFIFFIGSCGAFGVTLSLLTPSRDCGPFATKKFPVDLITDVNTTVVTVLISPGTMVIVIVALCVAAHYTHVVSNGKRELVRLLREQIVLECKDKVFLQKLLEQIQKAKVNRKSTERVLVSTIGASSSNDQGAEEEDTDSSRPRPAAINDRDCTRADIRPESSSEGGRKIFARIQNARSPATEDSGYHYAYSGKI